MSPIGGGGGGGGGGSTPFVTATVTLTNAQIKALPTTPVELVPAPGAGKVLVPIFAWLHLVWVADYTNIAADSLVKFQGSDNSGSPLASFSETLGDVSNLLADGASHTAYSAARQGIYSANPTTTLAVGQANDDPDGVNVALQLASTNTGNFTGGNVGNSLKVTVYYATFTN